MLTHAGRGPYIALVLERMKGKVHVVERLAVVMCLEQKEEYLSYRGQSKQYAIQYTPRRCPVLNGCSRRPVI